MSDHDAYAEAIVEAITQPLLVLDEELRVKSANRAFYRTFEVTPEDTLGRLVYEIGNGQWDIAELRRRLEAVLTEDTPVEEYRVEHDFEGIGERIMMVNANRVRMRGAPDRTLMAISDVTERERLIYELAGQKEFVEKLVDSLREALLILDSDLRVHSANQSFYQDFGATPEETVGRPVYELANGQWDIPMLRKLLEEILPRETVFNDYEIEQEFENIGRRVMLLNARRLDHFDLILLAIRDITRRRAAEQRQKAFTGELQHSTKNVLNNVLALAKHTARSTRSTEEFLEAFEARLGALARAQNLLVSRPSEPVALHDIVRLELEPVGVQEGKDYTIEGPAVRIRPQDIQALAMTVHELTTNAAKYGAFRSEEGWVEITWRIHRQNQNRYLTFMWREHGLRIEETEPVAGFGSKVICEMVPYLLQGTAEWAVEPDGIRCKLEFLIRH